METKLSTEQLNAKKQNWDYNQGLVLSSNGLSGGLALLWKLDTKVHVKNFSRWFIDAHIFCGTTGLCWRLIGFYGYPETSKREESWAFLESLGRSNHLPWRCVGDFNEITSQSKKVGGCLRPARQMDHFRRTIHLCDLIDLGYYGSPFTWSCNHPKEGRTHIRLDQALTNNTWKLLFPGSSVHYVSMPSSDHSMLTILLKPSQSRKPRYRPLFRFEAMWLQDPRCAEVVQEAWHEGLYISNGDTIINCHNTCCHPLTEWNKREFGHVGNQIERLDRKLQLLE